MNMFCYQCEQTAKGTGCTVQGVCTKAPETAALQDLLVHAAKGLAMYAHRARKLGVRDHAADTILTEALFSTLTNVNFDDERLCELIQTTAALRDEVRGLYEQACQKAGRAPERLGGPAAWTPAATRDALVRQGSDVSILKRKQQLGDDITGLQELITYGLKGVAAYAYHAACLGKEDDEVYSVFHEVLDFLAGNPTSVDDLVNTAFRVGELNLKVMGLLDAANTAAYGNPVPTPVRVEPIEGKAIVVSGHDLRDLEELLKQTEGTGINVYTHGEMLPAHGYPGLKKYRHLVGNYGGAWQEQQKEFEHFPGAILMTTNCLMKPRESYKGRLFSCGPVGYPGVRHIRDRKFRPVIEAALAAEGFKQGGSDKTILVGFGHAAVMSVAGQVIEAVKKGAIRHFFLVGGCDGARPGRNYYTEFARLVPKDCVILTLACGKYRFNKLDFGTIGGIPRLLDIGQCNDSYSAIQIAVALAKAFNTDVNSLPLSLVLSWYEQKACAILLTLLHLGVKNIRIGPTLPAFVTPPVLDVLVRKFNLAPISTPEKDIQALLAK